MTVLTGQGEQALTFGIPKGLIIAFYGTAIPIGWALCDGTNGTPDLTGRVLVGDTAISTGTAGGTEPATTGLTHSGFALANHSNHVTTQPAAHSDHVATQPAAHSNHVATQPDQHGAHVSQGDHAHNAHTVATIGSNAVTGTKLTGLPTTHSTTGAHTHTDVHTHNAFAVDVHSAHSAFAVDSHSAHSAAAVDTHSAHSMTQASNHLYKVRTLAHVMKI